MEPLVRAQAGQGPLGDWLAAPELQAERLLPALLDEAVRPAVGRALGSRLRRLESLAGERADLEQEALLRVVARLRLARDGAAAPPEDLPGYAAVVAHNLVSERLRELRPRRAALKARLRYHLRHSPELTLEPGPGPARCGLAAWGALSAAERWMARLGWAQRRAELDGGAARVLGRRGAGDPAGWPLPRLCVALLEHAGAAVEVDDLVDWVAAVLGVVDAPPRALDASDEQGPAEPAADASETLDQRSFLARLWAEVLQLPERQRLALLLNLRDEGGGDALHVLVACGLATLGQLARALGWPVERLLAVWDDLPLEDARLAGELGLARQQVINLRKSARARLARRLRRVPGGAAGSSPEA